MVRLGTLHIRRLAFAALCALAIAACGSGQKLTATNTTTAKPTHNSTTVDIYSSLPDSGPDAASSHQIEKGIELALTQVHHKVGKKYRVKYVRLSDASLPPKRSGNHAPTSRAKVSVRTTGTPRTRSDDGWNQTAAVGNAEAAARNPETVAYIGDLNSAATELSAPIINQARIVQVTPGSGYTGLTNSVKPVKGLPLITGQGEPNKYYPQGSRTLLRMIPNDLVQASAALDVLKKEGCQKFSVWQFGSDTETNSLFAAVIATAPKYRMVYFKAPALPKSAKDYVSYADSLRPDDIRCAILVGHVTPAASALTLYLREQLTPSPPIVGTSGFCNSGWVHGIPKINRNLVVPGLYCMTPNLPVKEYTGHAAFTKAFRRAYHRAPTAFNFYGYIAAEMVILALQDDYGITDNRSRVLTNIFEDNAPNAVLGGAFSFDPSGNVYSDLYGVDDFKDGVLRHHGSVEPVHLLPSGG